MRATETPTVGECRVTSAGNVYRLDRIDGRWRYVRRVAADGSAELWDRDVTWRWSACQWEEGIPLVDGPKDEYPAWGHFAPR